MVGNKGGFKISDEDFIFLCPEERLPRGATERIQKHEIRDATTAQLGLKKDPSIKVE